jgi:hypothetical protein
VLNWLGVVVYPLCLCTSAACTILLFRNHHQTHERMALWTAFFFFLITCNNALLVIQTFVSDWNGLTLPRHILTIAALLVLLFGFIWQEEG